MDLMHVNHKSDRLQNRLQGVHDKRSGVEYKWTSCIVVQVERIHSSQAQVYNPLFFTIALKCHLHPALSNTC